MTTTTNGERKLLVRNNHFDFAGILIENNFGHFGRLQCVHKECWLIIIPWNDVDFFALKLIHNGLYTRTAHTDTGANGINGAVIGNHSNLCARSGITSNSFNLNDAIVDFRHFHLEQFGHEFRRSARQENLRTARFAAHILDETANSIIGAIRFAANFFVAAQNAFATTNVYDNVAILFALHNTINNRACTIFEFFVLAIALGFANLLQDNLLCGLRSDTAKLHRRDLFGQNITNRRVRHVFFGLLDGQLSLIILKIIVLNNRANTGKGCLASLAIDGHMNVHFRAVTRLCSACEALLHRFNNDRRIDHFFACYGLGGLQQLKLVCRGDCHNSVLS